MLEGTLFALPGNEFTEALESVLAIFGCPCSALGPSGEWRFSGIMDECVLDMRDVPDVPADIVCWSSLFLVE
jgi:hypothetical protein